MSILVLTSDTLIGTPATGNIEYNGQFYGTDSNASRAQMQRIALGASQATTSGTSIVYTGLPSWVQKITVMLNGVSTNGTAPVLIQLGTGATPTYTTTGYVSGSNALTTTVGLIAHGGGAAADVRLGSCVITSFGGNIWNSAASGGFANGAGGTNAGGYISLGATLTAIRLIASTTSSPADTFDAGSVNILYEG